MEANELQEARTNPEFLRFLSEKEENARESKNLKDLYEVLDTMLVLDLDMDKVDSVYEEILKNSFEKVEEKLLSGSTLDLTTDEFYAARAMYEHGIEQWSNQNFGGAKQMFFILNSIISDEILGNALMVHIINTHNHTSLDSFYTTIAKSEQSSDDKYGYFITKFDFDTVQYLTKNKSVLDEINQQMQSMIM
jgi:hypothetical protein